MGGGYIAKARPLCHSEERSDEESKAIARKTALSWGETLWILHRVQNDRRGAASVILRSEATKNPKPPRDCCVYILTNETHGLYIEPENPKWVDLSAEWSEALDSSLRSE